jgi:hypothetical protein
MRQAEDWSPGVPFFDVTAAFVWVVRDLAFKVGM